MANSLPPVPRITKTGFADPVWPRWLNELRDRVIGTVIGLRIAASNGFNGTVTVDPQGNAVVSLGITVSGVLKGAGGAIATAVPGVDYLQSISGTAPVVVSPGAVPNVSMPQSGGSSNGWLSSTDWNTFNNKLSQNQAITLSGDVTGAGNTAITTTLAASGVTAGSYGSSTTIPILNVDAKGRITGASVTAITVPPIPVGPTSGRPVGPANGLQYLDTTIGQPIWALNTAGTGWINSAGVSV